MKYAILSDIHANIDALESVLAHARTEGCEQFVCLGDVVGYNANPAECVAKIREMEMPCILGNHDEYSAKDIDLSSFNPVAAEAVVWTREQLTPEDRQWLAALRYVRLVDSFTIVHATMDGPRQWGYVQDKMAAAASFTYQSTPICFHGHTHVPLAFMSEGGKVHGGTYNCVQVEQGKKYFINVGSVGQPRDSDPRAAYVIYDDTEKRIDLQRVEYDIESAQAKIRAAGLPDRLAERLALGR